MIKQRWLKIAKSLSVFTILMFAFNNFTSVKHNADGTIIPEDNSPVFPGRLLVQPRPGTPQAEFDKALRSVGAQEVGRIDKIDVRMAMASRSQFSTVASMQIFRTLPAKSFRDGTSTTIVPTPPTCTATEQKSPAQLPLSPTTRKLSPLPLHAQ